MPATTFTIPVVQSIGYTSAKLIVPDNSTWPVGATQVDLELKESTSNIWSKVRTQLVAGTTIVLNETNLLSGKTYNVKFTNNLIDGDIATFTTLTGVISSSTAVLTPQVSSYPEVPGPITFDNPHSTSVDVIYKDNLPLRTELLELVYRAYDPPTNNLPWAAFTVTNFAKNEILHVKALSPDTEYEFAFRATNYLGSVYGPIARYKTNRIDDPGEVTPDSPVLTVLPCPDGRTAIDVQLPVLIGGSTGIQLEIALSVDGPWSPIGSVVSSALLIHVTNLTANTKYYFRVTQTGGNATYVGNVSSATTKPLSPSKPGNLVLSGAQSQSIEVKMPILPTNTDYLVLERGQVVNGVISWERRWEKLTAGEIFPDVDVTEDKIYVYRAIAVNECGETLGDITTQGSFSDFPDSPGPIKFVEIFGTYLSIKRDFPNPNKSITVALQTSIDNINWSTIKNTVENNETVIVNNLQTSFVYYYRFISVNNFGIAKGCEAGVTTDFSDDTSFFERPDVPVFISREPRTEITVTLPNLPVNADGLSVWYGSNVNGPWRKLGGEYGRYPSNSNVTLIGLDGALTYYLFTAAYSGTRVRLSNRIEVKTPPMLVPTPVATLSQDDNTKVLVTYASTENPLASDIDSLSLFKSLDGVTYTQVGGELKSANSYLLESLTANTHYYIKLVASNSGGKTSSQVTQFTTFKDKPGLPGSVIFDEVEATRLVVLRLFSFPARAEKVSLYKVDNSTGIKTKIYDFLLESETSYRVINLTPVNSTFYFQFSASNNGGEVFGPIAGVNTNETEIKLPPKKPLPPVIGDDIGLEYTGRVFAYHVLEVSSPIWSNSTTYPVEGMELWYQKDDGNYIKQLNFEGTLNDYYSVSSENNHIHASRCTIYKFKVRAFNIENSVTQYSPFSDEVIVDLNSTTCVVKILTPTNNSNVVYRTPITFTVDDLGGHSGEEIVVRNLVIT